MYADVRDAWMDVHISTRVLPFSSPHTETYKHTQTHIMSGLAVTQQRRGSTPSLPSSPALSTHSLSASSTSTTSSLSPGMATRKMATLPASFTLHAAASTAENSPAASPASSHVRRHSTSRTPSPQPESRSIKLKTDAPTQQPQQHLKPATGVFPNMGRVEDADVKQQEDVKQGVATRRAPRAPEMVVLEIRCKNMPVTTTVVGVFEMMTQAFRYLDHTDVQR